MNGPIRIATVRGIPIAISPSWLIVFALVLWSFAASYYPARYPGWTTRAYYAAGLATALLFFAAIVVHELGHALAAARFGIRTRRITLWPLGGLAELEREPARPAQEFAVALAGPATSLLLGALCLGLNALVAPLSQPLGGIAAYLGMANLALALFNLLPGFPLDGGRVLRGLVWGATGSYARGTRIAAGAGSAIAYAFIVGGVILTFNGFLANGVLLAFTGWFVLMGAQGSARQLILQQELAGVTVGLVMTRDVATARAGATLAQALDETFSAHGARAVAVERDGRFVGLVTLGDVARIPRGRWAETPVEAAMTPLARLVSVMPADQVLAALARIQGGSFNQLPVVADGRIVGLLTRHDLLRFVQRRAALHPPQATADSGGPARAVETARQPT